MEERKAIYPGSFDPLTLGHYDILMRSTALFDKVYIAVGVNMEKHPIFTLEERRLMIKKVIGENPKIEVLSFDGLITNFMKEEKIKILVRGLRDTEDLLHESRMSRMNKVLYPEMETVFLHTAEAFAYISSSLIKEIVKFGGSLESLVPKEIMGMIEEKFSSSN